jgi:hypothetical protein
MDLVQITPVVVMPSGAFNGRGTFSSPLRLCGPDWLNLLEYGDMILLGKGTHACRNPISLRPGVVVRGEDRSQTIVGDDVSAPFGGFSFGSANVGTAAVENLTFTSASSAGALQVSGGKVAVTDVDILGVSGYGVHATRGGMAIVTRLRARQNVRAALFVDGGRIDARDVEIEGSGAFALDGTLNLTDARITSEGVAVVFGTNSTGHEAAGTIVGSVLRSKQRGVFAGSSHLTIRDTTIEATDPAATSGIDMLGGSLIMVDSSVRNWPDFGIETNGLPALFGPSMLVRSPAEAANVTLDRVEISGSRFGLWYDAGWGEGELHMRHSHVSATERSVTVTRYVAVADLGTTDEPGDNQLETMSSGVALDVSSDTPSAVMFAHGTTLNGITYTGDIQGPAEVPGGYRIFGNHIVHF